MKDKIVTLKLEIDIRKMRLALVGNGYLLEEVEKMTDNEIITIWRNRFSGVILESYWKGISLGLYKAIGE